MPRPLLEPTVRDRWRLAILAAVMAFAGLGVGAAKHQTEAAVPVAVVWIDENRLAVALREARAIAIVEVGRERVQEWIPIPFRPASLLEDGEGGWWVGGQDGELVALGRDGTTGEVRRVGSGPVRMARLPGRRLAVAACWDRTVVRLGPRGEIESRIVLPFEPGEVLALPDGRLVAADAFRGRLAVVDPGGEAKFRLLTLDGVGLRGLVVAPNGSEVLLASMATSGPAPLSATNLDWGLILSSKLWSLRVNEDLGDEGPVEPLRLTLDGSGHGAADPVALVCSKDGRFVFVACRGSHRVVEVDRSLGAEIGGGRRSLGDRQRLREIEVGRNPVDLAISPEGRRLATADLMSDTVTILTTGPLRVERTIGLNGAEPTRSAELRGEAVFLDGRAALDAWITCSSCHPGGHTVGLLFDTQGDGSYGDPKDTPSLLGVGQTPPFGWTGRFDELGEQLEHSLRNSLHGPIPTRADVEDLTAYLVSLKPSPPIPPRGGQEELVERGAEAFRRLRCVECHVPPTYASRPLRDVVSQGTGESYSVPSLRGVCRTPPYFHDGGAPTLDDVLRRHHPEQAEPPGDADRAALIAFLESL